MKKSKKSKRKTKKKENEQKNIEEEDDDSDLKTDNSQVEIPDEFSIDRLLETRKTELSNIHLSSPVKCDSSDSTTEEPEFKAPINITKYVPRDASTFEFSQGNFPFRIFEILECPEVAPTHCLPILKQWEWLALKFNCDSVLPNATLFFSLIQELLLKKSDEVGLIFLEYAESFPDNSILEFNMWFDFVREAMHSSVQSVVYLLAVADINLFKFDNDKDKNDALDRIILLNISAMICPAISENNMYGLVLTRLRETLKTNQFSEKQINFYVETCFDLVLDIPISNISLIVSKFPLEGSGIDIIYYFTIRIALFLLTDEFELNEEDQNIEKLTNEIKNLKQLCESPNDEDIIKASAVIALYERTVVTGIKRGSVNDELIESAIRNFKFSINSSDPGILTALKEQIHITRTQFETLHQTQEIIGLIRK